MNRNLDYRIEAAVKITDKDLKKEIKDILNIQLNDNVKARVLNKRLSNEYYHSAVKEEHRSQIETYKCLKAKTTKK
jgi:polyphosphate kinase